MLKRTIAALLILSGCAAPQNIAIKPMPREKFVVYYDKKVPVDSFKEYNLVVFDATRHPDFTALQPKTTVLGYVSIGEVHNFDELLPELRAENAILAKNSTWNSYIVDVRNKTWRNYILKEKIPALVKAGFDGVMIDTVDSAIAFETPDASQYAGMYYSAATLIHDIRRHYPDLKIMINRGFALLDALDGDIDYVLAESVYAKIDPKTSRPSVWDESEQKPVVALLHRAMKNNPQLKVYTLDYWDISDVQGINSIYQTQRSRGFIPYVATPDLRSYHAEPMQAGVVSSPSRG